MNKCASLCLFLLCYLQPMSAQDSCYAPMPCPYWPFAECCDNYCWFGGCCHPGLYMGGQVGYAWIQTPYSDNLKEEFHEGINEHRGDFAWGVFGGYTICFWCRNLYVGIEGGYHDNGSSELTFKESGNRYKLRSRDIDISATIIYVIRNCYDVFFKVGGARVRETFKVDKKEDENDALSSSSARQWAPVINTGIGYCLFNWLNVSLAYRGVFANDTDRLTDAFKAKIKNGELSLSLKEISTVHSVYGGLTLTF